MKSHQGNRRPAARWDRPSSLMDLAVMRPVLISSILISGASYRVGVLRIPGSK